LIVDIPSDQPGDVFHRCEDYTKCFHSVNVVRNSQLHLTSQADTGMITTNHHQAIEKPAPGIRITAWSADSIAEAMEWAEPEGKSFLMAVQWHPERMDTLSPLSMPLVESFLQAAEEFRKRK
jgi:putative glutamine amidotransferase